MDRQSMPIRGKLIASSFRTSIACVRASALLSLASCASIWGFDDLRNSANSGESGGEGAIDSGGGAGSTGSGGAPTAIKDDGSSGPVDSGGAGGGEAGAAGGGGGDATGGAAGSLVGSGGAAGSDEGGSGHGGSDEGGRTDGALVVDGARGTGGTLESGADVGADGADGARRQEGGGTGGTVDAGICAVAPRELLTNGSFEDGEAGWLVSVAGGFPIVYVATGAGGMTPDVVAQSAPNVTWIGGYDRADDSIRQAVGLPANATSMTLSFYYAIVTRETGTVENDVMNVAIVAGAQTIPLAHYSNLDAVDAWTRFSAPLPSSLAGQTVTLQFSGTTNGTAITSFYVDTISLQVVACP